MSIRPREIRRVDGGRVVVADCRFLVAHIRLEDAADGREGSLITDTGETVGTWQAAFTKPETKPRRTPTPRPPQSRILPPGTWLSMLIQVATVGLVRPCTSCKSRARAMDRMGWRGLLRLPTIARRSLR